LGLVSLTEDGRPCLLQLPEGAALESDSVDLDDVVCVPTMSDDGAGAGAAPPLQANAAPAGAAARTHTLCPLISARTDLQDASKRSPSACCIRIW